MKRFFLLGVVGVGLLVSGCGSGADGADAETVGGLAGAGGGSAAGAGGSGAAGAGGDTAGGGAAGAASGAGAAGVGGAASGGAGGGAAGAGAGGSAGAGAGGAGGVAAGAGAGGSAGAGAAGAGAVGIGKAEWVPVATLGTCQYEALTNPAEYHPYVWKACAGEAGCEQLAWNGSTTVLSAEVRALMVDEVAGATSLAVDRDKVILVVDGDGVVSFGYRLVFKGSSPCRFTLRAHSAGAVAIQLEGKLLFATAATALSPALGDFAPSSMADNIYAMAGDRFAWLDTGGLLRSVHGADTASPTVLFTPQDQYDKPQLPFSAAGSDLLFSVGSVDWTNPSLPVQRSRLFQSAGASETGVALSGYAADGGDDRAPMFAHSHLAWVRLYSKDAQHNSYTSAKLFAVPWTSPLDLSGAKPITEVSPVSFQDRFAGFGRYADTMNQSVRVIDLSTGETKVMPGKVSRIFGLSSQHIYTKAIVQNAVEAFPARRRAL